VIAEHSTASNRIGTPEQERVGLRNGHPAHARSIELPRIPARGAPFRRWSMYQIGPFFTRTSASAAVVGPSCEKPSWAIVRDILRGFEWFFFCAHPSEIRVGSSTLVPFDARELL
jgi:hypothetical protein